MTMSAEAPGSLYVVLRVGANDLIAYAGTVDALWLRAVLARIGRQGTIFPVRHAGPLFAAILQVLISTRRGASPVRH